MDQRKAPLTGYQMEQRTLLRAGPTPLSTENRKEALMGTAMGIRTGILMGIRTETQMEMRTETQMEMPTESWMEIQTEIWILDLKGASSAV